jgi:hypothetical protein
MSRQELDHWTTEAVLNHYGTERPRLLDISTEIFLGFSVPSGKRRIVSRSRHGRLRSNPFPFIIHRLARRCTAFILSGERKASARIKVKIRVKGRRKINMNIRRTEVRKSLEQKRNK